MSPLRRGIIAAALAVVAANVFFLTLMLQFLGDPQLIAERTRAAFKAGAISTDDFPKNNSHLGANQYNDCNALQMISNYNPTRTDRGLAPKVFYLKSDTNFVDACDALQVLTVGNGSAGELLWFKYTRYWFGYLVPAATVLRWGELATYRGALKLLVWLSIAALGMTAFRAGRRTRSTLIALVITAGLFWAVPYFAPGITTGPGDAVLLLGLCLPVLLPRLVTDYRLLLPFAAAYGALVVFLEAFTGQLVVAAGWLGALAVAVLRDSEEGMGARPPIRATAALAAFGFGGITTVAAKQLVVPFTAPDSGREFAQTLSHYMSVPKPVNGIPGILVPFVDLARSMNTLTYWNQAAGIILAAATVVVLIAAVIQALRYRNSDAGQCALFLVLLCFLPAVWTLLFPNHTHIHALFMVRMFVVPISLAPLAFWWTRSKERVHADEGQSVL